MLWLIVAIIAYFFLAVVALFDRYFLVGSIPHPKVYTFYVGILWCFLGLFLMPFVDFPLGLNLIILGLLAGFVRTFAILFLTKTLIEVEVSRAIPAIGGFLPIFSFLFFFSILPLQEIINPFQVIAFSFLVGGSVLISLKKISVKFVSPSSLKYPIIAAFLFAFSYFLSKLLFLETNFLNSSFLFLAGGGLGAASLLISRQTKNLIFSQKMTPKISTLFILGQIFGGLGVGFLYYAVFLAKPSQVPLVNALEGIRYVFILFFAIILAKKIPQILKEQITKEVIFQKIIAILFIGAGLMILATK